jgi:hypothetical protein
MLIDVPRKKKKKTETKKKGPISQIRKYACLDQPR